GATTASTGRRATAGCRPPAHSPDQPVPPPARPDLSRTGPAHQRPCRRLGVGDGPPHPTAALLAQATEADLDAVAYLPAQQRAPLLEHARCSIASLSGPIAEELVRDQVRQLRDVGARQKRLENLLVCAYHALPQPNHFDSIPGQCWRRPGDSRKSKAGEQKHP